MTLKQKIAGAAATAILAAGIAFAQHHGFGRHHGNHIEFLSTYLDLTEAQQEGAKAIFENGKASSKPLIEELKRGHEAIAEAVKDNRPAAELEALGSQQGVTIGRLAGMHAKAMASFYATLTPAQQEKAAKLHDRFNDRIAKRFGR